MTWQEIVTTFHVTSAAGLLSLPSMVRYQNAPLPWLTSEKPPFVLLFLSHRWESPEHPDPTGRLMASVHTFLRQILLGVEAMLVARPERLALVPSLAFEGTLQAEEVARRLLGYGPFSDHITKASDAVVRTVVTEQFRQHGRDRDGFRNWLAERIAVWLDYTCMPQRPLDHKETMEFERTLRMLDQLVEASTLVALRDEHDDYAVRGWCLLEAFMGSARSFARAVVVDIDRLARGAGVSIPTPAASNDAAL